MSAKAASTRAKDVLDAVKRDLIKKKWHSPLSLIFWFSDCIFIDPNNQDPLKKNQTESEYKFLSQIPLNSI